MAHQELLTKPKTESKGFDNSLVSFKTLNAKLYDILIRPVEDKLSQRIIIIPHGLLNQVNFEVLISDEVTGSTYRELAYFSKTHEISYGYSSSLIISPNQIPYKNKNHYIGFAPHYLKTPVYQSGKNSTTVVDEFSVDTRSYLGPLKYNTAEIRETQSILGGEIFINDAANEKALTINSNRAGILHLAMHALINDENSKYSFLAMTPSSSDDGIIYPYEIYPLDLKCELVVLSGCKTGIGEIKSGEGLISLARAFKLAGANSLVSSLWEVNDRTSKDIMVSFFKYLKKGNSKSSALRMAKQDFLFNEVNEHYSHPYYWAGFVLIGNPDPLFNQIHPGLLFGLLFGLLLFVIWGITKIKNRKTSKGWMKLSFK